MRDCENPQIRLEQNQKVERGLKTYFLTFKRRFGWFWSRWGLEWNFFCRAPSLEKWKGKIQFGKRLTLPVGGSGAQTAQIQGTQSGFCWYCVILGAEWAEPSRKRRATVAGASRSIRGTVAGPSRDRRGTVAEPILAQFGAKCSWCLVWRGLLHHLVLKPVFFVVVASALAFPRKECNANNLKVGLWGSERGTGKDLHIFWPLWSPSTFWKMQSAFQANLWVFTLSE